MNAISLPDSAPPPLVGQQEIFGSAGDAAAIGLALQMSIAAADPGRSNWLWVQDRRARQMTGRPFVHGLPRAFRAGLIYVAAETVADALFALEEGLHCRDMAFVIGEMAGEARALGFTASRRLAVASERHGVPLCLVRLDVQPALSAARRRWRVAAHPAHADPWHVQAPGTPRWRAELFRARDLPPAHWIVEDAGQWQRASGGDDAAHPVDLAAQPRH
jgi:protein ImuA